MDQSTKKTIALHGSYYHENFGDMLLIDIMAKWIKEHNQQNEVLLPHAPQKTTEVLNVEGRGFSSLYKANALIYGGGGYLGEPPSKKYMWGFRSTMRHFPASKLMKLQKKPYSVIGTGVGPLTNPIAKNAFANLCKGAEVLGVRDIESKNFLIDYGINENKIIQTSDIVMQMNKKDIEEKYFEEAYLDLKELKKPIKIGVHIGHNSFKKGTTHIKEEIIEIAKNNNDIGIVLLCDGSGSPPEVVQEIKKELPSQSIIVSYKNHWYFSALLGSMSLVITTKLHVGITATALGRTAISFPAHSKTPRFYKEINALDRCIPLNRLKKYEAGNLIKKHIKENKYEFKAPNEVLERANKNKEILNSFLEKV